jgi:tRNA pseudouridine55 synthase
VDATLDGIFLFDKPQGFTSHDAVAKARRWFNTRRVGHAGTLDPMATGLLTLCINNGARVAEYLTGEDKRYRAVIRLGERTNTDDAEGEVLTTRAVPEVSPDILRRVEARFTGEIEQVPPQFSAIKKDGVRAYTRARHGEEFELAARPVIVHSLHLSPAGGTTEALVADVHCGSGTYVRSLARDIGELLGCGGHLTALRRLTVGPFRVEDALSLEQAQQAAADGNLSAHLMPIDRALADMPAVMLDEVQTRRLLLGQFVPQVDTDHVGERRVYDSHGVFIAVGRLQGGLLRPVKVFGVPSAASHHADSEIF